MDFDLEEFLGREAKYINRIIWLIAKKSKPEWLRGRACLSQLPRFIISDLKNYVELPILMEDDVADMCEWIVLNLYGDWTLTTKGFFFTDDNDAVMFKLKWK